MAEPQDPNVKVRLKFKRICQMYGQTIAPCLLPNGYRLATVEEIRNNLDIFVKWGMPIKTTTGRSFEESDTDCIRILPTGRSFEESDTGCIRLLDGYIEDSSNIQPIEGPDTPPCEWHAAVKIKEWDSGIKKWRNCSALYSSKGNLLRKQLYDGITLTAPGIQTVLNDVCLYKDVELLYWLLQNHQNSFQSFDFNNILSAWKIIIWLQSHEPSFQLEMENEKEEARTVFRSVMEISTKFDRAATWGLAMVEFLIELYGLAFVETVAEIVFENVESVPIFTKLLSLSLHRLQDQIPNIKPRFAEVLIEAVERGYSPLVEKMLEFTDDIAQITADDCVRVLRVAVGGGDIELARSLLHLLKSRDGVELPVEVDDKGKTLFHYALPHAQVFHLLQQTYASSYHNIITRQDKFGRSILHWVAKGAYDSEVLDRLLKMSSAEHLILSRDYQERTPLHVAASKGDSGLLAKLVSVFGTSQKSRDYIQATDSYGQTALHMAAGEGHEYFIKMLLDNGSDPLQERDVHRKTALHHVAQVKHPKAALATCEALLENLSSDSKKSRDFIRATDSYGQTALHMAAGEGREYLIKMLLVKGSDPLQERDVHRKTALHHAAQVKHPKAALATCKALLENLSSHKHRSLLLWASATGIGTADEMEAVHSNVKTYLRSQKESYRDDLLRKAAVINNAEMAWELLNRGADMEHILDPQWREKLDPLVENSVQNVISHMERMKEQGRDQPSMEDKLGRHVFAEGLSALLLNRFIESPITVGISGEWGMGKSSLMIQTEKILLITAAQLTFPNLLPSEQFGGAKKISLSTRGRKIYRQIKRGVHNLLALQKDKRPEKTYIFADPDLPRTRLAQSNYSKIYQQITEWAHNLLSRSKHKSEDPLVTMLMEYQPRYHAVYKSLACMDNNQMLQSNSRSQQQQEHALRGVPRILTIRYNAWHYRDRHEAWAGLGVTITKEIEKAMTRAQWMSTCWRYSWAKHSVNIWIQVFLPCLLSISLAGWVAWIVWMLLKQAKFQGLKYGSIPFTVIAIAWVVLKSVISVVKPVSTQMLGYITSTDHTSHLGYQENVIADINFLKEELGKKPHWFFSFILGLWCWNWFGLYVDVIEHTRIPKFMPASEDQIRIVTFVDDLDRCEEEVILQVLSAVNLVLAECKINVILGTDKKMIARAIKRKFEDVDDEDLAEKFICKIIQIPLSLPDPTGQETKRFLEYHLGHKIPDIKKENIFGSPGGLGGLGGLGLPVEPSREEEETSIEEEETSTSQEESVAPILEENVVTCCNSTVLNIGCTELKQGCRGTIKNAVDRLGCLLGFAFTLACNISTELSQPCDESFNSLRSAEGVRLIRELLLPKYTEEEAYIFYELSEFASGNQNLPREWKRLLHYHKFAWYVLFRIGNIYNLPTWKEELIGWIFVCWQWKREMNHLIKHWRKYTTGLISNQNKDRKQRYGRGPLLSEIVAKCMDQLKNPQSPVSEGSDTTKRQEDFLKLIGSSKQDPSMKAILCLYKDNEGINEEGTSQYNWSDLKRALEIRDVSMEAIQLFEKFRFYCETDLLPGQMFDQEFM